MKFNLPRRQRKSFESITKKMISDNFNKTESTELFSNLKNNTLMLPVLLELMKEKRGNPRATNYYW